jgi:hypothetical protein
MGQSDASCVQKKITGKQGLQFSRMANNAMANDASRFHLPNGLDDSGLLRAQQVGQLRDVAAAEEEVEVHAGGVVQLPNLAQDPLSLRDMRISGCYRVSCHCIHMHAQAPQF